jgi:hypothetical protein
MSASIPQSAGIDISKDWLDVHLHASENYQRFANDAAGHKALFKWFGGWSIERIAYEQPEPITVPSSKPAAHFRSSISTQSVPDGWLTRPER